MMLNPNDLNEQQRYDTIMGSIVPRPVVLITTVSPEGIFNAAPFSSCAPVCHNPPMFCFSSGYRRGMPKDTTNNIRNTRSFVVNTVTENMLEKILKTAEEFPPDVDEIKEAGFTPIKSEKVGPPRLYESPMSMECILRHEIGLGRTHNLFIGEVLCIHIKDEFLKDGAIDNEKFCLLGRLSGDYYCKTSYHVMRKRTWVAGQAEKYSTES